MGVQTGFWRIQQDKPVRIQPTAIDYEKRLEALIEADWSIIAEPRRWLVIGRQVPAVHGGIIDLLAMDETGALIVVELKRDRTDREAVLLQEAFKEHSARRFPKTSTPRTSSSSSPRSSVPRPSAS